MRRLSATLLVLSIVLCGTSVTSAETIDDGGVWLALFTQGDVCDDDCNHWKWWYDGHLRFRDDAGGFNQSIVRPGIGYALEKATIWAGYGWIRTSPVTGDDVDENRVWQQLTCSKQLSSVKLGARSRLEQRFVETGDDVGWRFRQFFRAQRPLCADSRVMFVTWDEVFFHLNDTDWGAAGGFDQNRLFVGLGLQRQRDSRFRVEVGYFHQFIDRSTGDDLSNHILAVNVFRNP